MLADNVEGRVINIRFDVTLLPPSHPVESVGGTDRAMEISQGLITEAMALIKAAGEAEGFTVQMKATRTVY